MHLALTVDYNGYARIYFQGIEIGSQDISAESPLVLTEWQLGNDYNGGYQSGFRFSEYAILDSILTAEEVAALYARHAPLVDAGALKKPVTDGRYVRIPVSVDDVSSPPTDAELTTALGWQPDGFTALVDDNDAGTTVWKVWRTAEKWWYEGLTAAV